MAELNIYRGENVLVTVSIGEDTMRESFLMGDDRITAAFEYYEAIDFLPYDYILHNNRKYSIKGNEIPSRTEKGERLFSYEVSFKAPEYRLNDQPFEHRKAPRFDYFGTPETVLQLIVDCMAQVDNGWDFEAEFVAEPKMLSFDNVTCRQAITQLAEAFEMEYGFKGNTIVMAKQIGNELEGVTFSQGKGKGLYELTELAMPDAVFGTRFKGFGGSQNLPAGYRDGVGNIVMTGEYIDSNVDLYGLVVKNVFFDDIIPSREGTLTAVVAPLIFRDDTLDFDINAQELEGAKLSFTSGELGGYDFEISSYDHATKTIRINEREDKYGYKLPNDTFKAKAGDKYKLIGIVMPESYITDAENRVAAKTEEFALKHSHPTVGFNLALDELYVRKLNLIGRIAVGTSIHVVSSKLSVDRNLRVTEMSYPIVNPSKLTVKIADKVNYTLAEKLIRGQAQNNAQIGNVERANEERARLLAKSAAEQAKLHAQNLRELQDHIFDPDGYFDIDRIKPLSIETNMLSVGAKSQNFFLSRVTMQPNFRGDANQFYISAGELQHREISIQDGYIWILNAQTFQELDPAKVYYLSARCSKDKLVATYNLSDTAIKVEDQEGFYNFQIGVLYPVGADNKRYFYATNGVSYLTGGQLTTGRIKSLDGQTWFDLDTGEIHGKITFTSDSPALGQIESILGANNLNIFIDSSQGDVLIFGQINTVLTATVMKYFNDISANVNSWKWTRTTATGVEDSASDAIWNSQSGHNLQSLMITEQDFTNIGLEKGTTFTCEARIDNNILTANVIF
ncbi:hypothetical protein [Sphingobacterium thalpophilum]|uniref:hypothetical protein n=1 Tax=Sphingobacterium thalpophilum TaxID=259 RepID=UPI0024A6606A|nr:hypothetical protein [Sphingobacterium thalpophilum]